MGPIFWSRATSANPMPSWASGRLDRRRDSQKMKDRPDQFFCAGKSMCELVFWHPGPLARDMLTSE
jgi:hypothetical protein